MRFEQFVKRYQVWIYGLVIVPLVIGLVLWGAPSSGRDDKSDEVAATFTSATGKTVEITGEDYQKMYRKVGVFRRLQWLEMMQRYAQQGFRLPPPDEKRIAQETWDVLVLLQYAKDMNMLVDMEEVQSELRNRPNTEQIIQAIEEATGAPIEVYEEAVRDQRSIGRLLSTVTDASFLSLEKLFTEAVQENKKVKLLYTHFDDKEFAKYTRPVYPRQIIHEYKQKYKDEEAHEKIQVDYLFMEFKPFKDKVPDPTEDEMKKYYEENKDQYLVPDDRPEPLRRRDRRDQRDQPRQFKPFEAVRESVKDRVKLKKAQGLAYNKMKEINLELGNLRTEAAKSGKTVDMAPLAAKYGVQYGATGWMAAEDVPQFEKLVGQNKDLVGQGFEVLKEGDFARGVQMTTEGCLIYRLLRKKLKYPLTMIDRPHRDRIVRDVREDYQSQAASQRANDFVQDIKTLGILAAARKYDVILSATSYVTKTDSSVFADTPEAYRILQDSLTMKPGEAKVVAGQDSKYVVYCEDVLLLTAEEIEKEVNATRKKKLEEHHRAEVSRHREGILKTANLKKKKPDQEEKP